MKSQNQIEVQTNVMVEMPDGIQLATDIYRPTAPAATILLRTCYGKNYRMEQGIGWARNGFICVIQDVRGRYDSQGDWQPYVNERSDGHNSVNWLARQAWNKPIVPYGASYAAFTALTAALSKHPSVQALILHVPAMGLPLVNFDESGVLNLAKHVHWWLEEGERRTTHPNLYATMLKFNPQTLNHLPVSQIPNYVWGEMNKWTQTILAGPAATPDYLVKDEELADLAIPILNVGGWYDLFLDQTLRIWEKAGSSQLERPSRKLIIGPWGHEINTTTAYGERDYGLASRLNLGKIQTDWLREKLGPSAQPPTSQVSLFQMGENDWVEGDKFPLISQATKTFYLHSNGTLSAISEPTQKHANDEVSFVYDPLDPYPATLLPINIANLGIRDDAVRFTTEPLTRPLSWQGSATLELTACSDALDTDWVAHLLEITPDGKVLPITSGMVNACRATSQNAIQNIWHTYQIKFKPSAVTIGVNHRLRLEIVSSNFPEQARCLNTGEDRYTSSNTRVATQKISCLRSKLSL